MTWKIRNQNTHQETYESMTFLESGLPKSNNISRNEFTKHVLRPWPWLVTTSTLAPAASSTSAVTSWPYSAAACSGLPPQTLGWSELNQQKPWGKVMESVAIEGEKAGVSSEKKDPIGLIHNSCLICALGVLDHAGQWLHVLESLKWGIVSSTRARFKTDDPSQTFDFVLRPYTKWSNIKSCSSSNAPLDT